MQATTLKTIYNRLESTYGPQFWWPGDSPFEIILGAILTQNTNWLNVEQALNNLKEKDLIDPARLNALSHKQLAEHIKPAGYFNVKAKRIKNFLTFLFKEYEGKLSLLKKEELQHLRKQLLSVNGIGPETADSILLYAFEKPIFVIDAYTKRILYRHGLIDKEADYSEMQDLMSCSINKDLRVYNEYHALIVKVGKDYCKPTPKCEQCPINDINYSLIQRCSQCFRAWSGDKGQKRTINGKACSQCFNSDL